MAADWRSARLFALLDAEMEGGAALDAFVAAGPRRRSRALAPALSVHVCAGTVPGVSVTSLVRALLTKSAVLLKPGKGDEVLPVLFCHALGEADPEIAKAVAVVYWRGGSQEPLERLALREADLLVVYGGEDTIAQVRASARGTTPVVAYPHRLGIAVLGDGGAEPAGERGVESEEDASSSTLERTAGTAARTLALFDQRGCVSPQLFFVLGSQERAAEFAAALAEALAGLERELPGGSLTTGEVSALHQFRGTAELESGPAGVRVWSGGMAAWTVVLSSQPDIDLSCPGRIARITPVSSVHELLSSVAPFRRHLQTVGFAGLDQAQLEMLAEGLARMGSARVAPLEAAPWPPPWWHHDGMGPLTALVRWTDVEDDEPRRSD
jgi:hypothetical protein